MKKLAAVLLSVLFAVPMFSAPRQMTFADNGFNGASLDRTEYKTIPFASKESDEIKFYGALPEYSDDSGRKNTCANVAGAIVLGYYDKDYDNLIENFTSTREIFGKIIYSPQTDAVLDVMARLYDDMKTNVTAGGTTVANFKSGLQTYVNEQGRNITYTQVVSNGQLQSSRYQQSINNGKPVVFFVSGYTVIATIALNAESGPEEYYEQYYVGNHTVVGYGYRTIRYYNAAGNLVKQLELLAVATGNPASPLVYISLDDYTNLIDGYEINIY